MKRKQEYLVAAPIVTRTFPVEEIEKQAGVVAYNIEAGKPEQAINAEASWYNQAMIMDKSLHGLFLNDIDKIKKSANYSLKEAAIDEYNEMNVNLFSFLAVKYFLESSRRGFAVPVLSHHRTCVVAYGGFS